MTLETLLSQLQFSDGVNRAVVEKMLEAGEAGGSERETALQRMAAAHRERLGYACGIRPFDA